jgi:1-acyl-sn-glycerol-3-phosphate acyltransferase
LPVRRTAEIRRWSRTLLGLLGVRLHVHGALPHGEAPVLVVANHVSWLDIFAVLATHVVRFVSKSEIRSWPVMGYLAARSGTLFLQRDRSRHAHRIGHEMADALRAGDVVAIFPEGTTTDGTKVLPFHASLLQPAITTGALVQPVAIRFLRSNGTVCTEVAYDGDRTLADTVRYPFAGHPVHAHLHFLEPIPVAALSRQALAAAAANAIASSLGLAAPDRESRRSTDLPDALR